MVPCENDLKSSIHALKGLRLVEKKDAIMFKSPEQASAVKTAIKATESMICVLPTAGGKTGIIHVPAFLERSKCLLTVVVVPLVALMDDHIHRLNKRGIPGFKCFQWDDQWYKLGIPQDVSILFVSVETAATTTFLNALKLIEDRLARIVIDEAYLAITWSDFRSDMHRLVYLRELNIPLIVLSASIQPRMEKELSIALGTTFTTTIRQTTVRPRLYYGVQWLQKTSDEMPSLINMLRTREDQLTDDDRVIIYCTSIPDTTNTATTIAQNLTWTGALCYHGSMAPKEKVDTLNAWRSGNCRVICATSAFGAGVDYAHVRLVVHRRGSASILDYAQETGRASRDNNDADCIVLASRKFHQRFAKMTPPAQVKDNAQCGRIA